MVELIMIPPPEKLEITNRAEEIWKETLLARTISVSPAAATWNVLKKILNNGLPKTNLLLAPACQAAELLVSCSHGFLPLLQLRLAHLSPLQPLKGRLLLSKEGQELCQFPVIERDKQVERKKMSACQSCWVVPKRLSNSFPEPGNWRSGRYTWTSKH